jgi:hypothetical protein
MKKCRICIMWSSWCECKLCKKIGLFNVRRRKHEIGVWNVVCNKTIVISTTNWEIIMHLPLERMTIMSRRLGIIVILSEVCYKDPSSGLYMLLHTIQWIPSWVFCWFKNNALLGDLMFYGWRKVATLTVRIASSMRKRVMNKRSGHLYH